MRKRLKNNVKVKTEDVPSDVSLLPKSTSENKKVLLQASRFHKGPLPLPEDLMKYNQIYIFSLFDRMGFIFRTVLGGRRINCHGFYLQRFNF